MAKGLAVPEQQQELNEPLLRLSEAARRLGLRPETLKKMAQRQEIGSVKFTKLRLFEPHVIRAFIAARRQG